MRQYPSLEIHGWSGGRNDTVDGWISWRSSGWDDVGAEAGAAAGVAAAAGAATAAATSKQRRNG